jgi:hypothetical protein
MLQNNLRILKKNFFINQFTSFIKSWDYFGYDVELHFGSHIEKDREHDSVHKTAYTGFLSVGINCILLYFVYFFIWQFFTNNQNLSFQNNPTTNWKNLASEQNVSINEA